MAKKTKNDVNKNLVDTLNEMEVVKEAVKSNKKGAPKKTTKKLEKIVRDTIEVKFKLLNEDAVLPSYAHPGDIGMDVVATDVEYNAEHDYYIYHTGLACEAEEGIAQFAVHCRLLLLGNGDALCPVFSFGRVGRQRVAHSPGALYARCIGGKRVGGD